MAAQVRKVTVLMAAGEYERFEGYCLANGFKKSTLIARLVRDHLNAAGFALQKDLPLRARGRKRSRQ